MMVVGRRSAVECSMSHGGGAEWVRCTAFKARHPKLQTRPPNITDFTSALRSQVALLDILHVAALLWKHYIPRLKTMPSRTMLPAQCRRSMCPARTTRRMLARSEREPGARWYVLLYFSADSSLVWKTSPSSRTPTRGIPSRTRPPVWR